MAGHDNSTSKAWTNDREIADLDHPSDTRQELGMAEAGCVATPIAGQVYCAYWKPSKSWYAAVVLPIGGFESIGIHGSLFQTSLAGYIPACYRSNKRERSILGWKSEYEDGGPKVNSRKFPMLYFNEDIEIPPEGHFSISNEHLLCWTPAKDLRPLNLHDEASRVVTGFKAAVNFSVRLEAIRKQLSLQEGPAATEGKSDIEDTCHMESARSARFQDSNRGKGDSIELGIPLDPTSPIAPLENNNEVQSSNTVLNDTEIPQVSLYRNLEFGAAQLARDPMSLSADPPKPHHTLDDSQRPQTAANLDQGLTGCIMSSPRAICLPNAWPPVTAQKPTNCIAMQDGQPEALGDAPLGESEEIKECTSVDSCSESRMHNNPSDIERLDQNTESGTAKNPNSGYESREAFKTNISYILSRPAEDAQTPAVLSSTMRTVARPSPKSTAYNCSLPLTALPALRENYTPRRL
ncbi:hypothetical protein GGR55DRAFT_151810 [Xylaria sp. FL0064]|nr:hypothetical protein GGR55DRAFT_151810 [Xylaria sp. FL0064]